MKHLRCAPTVFLNKVFLGEIWKEPKFERENLEILLSTIIKWAKIMNTLIYDSF